MDELEFLKSYYNSPGFDERLNRSKPLIDQYYKWLTNTRGFDPNAEYGFVKNPDRINNLKIQDYVTITPKGAFGDVEPFRVQMENYNPESNVLSYIPNKSNLKALLSRIIGGSMSPVQRKNGKDIDISEQVPDSVIDGDEPWYPTPSYKDAFQPMFRKGYPTNFNDEDLNTKYYQDLQLLRNSLYDLNIYDARKAKNPFTREHLNQYRKTAPESNNRIIKDFDDEGIINMMNTIAQNKPNNSNSYYAKRGIKLIPRKK